MNSASAAPQTADAQASAVFDVEGLVYAVPGGRRLLDGVTVGFAKGCVTGLIGHNGSGKTTLIRLLARQIRPTAGRIRFDGRPLESWDDRGFARQVAYLPQQSPAVGGMTARELIALGRYPWHGALGRFGTQDRAKVEEAIHLTDTAPFADRLVDTLSGGERQRVWLAMLVAQDADCLLLDEPISALDIAHQIEVLTLMRRLSEERRLSVVVVLHDINMAARFCDDLVALHGGRLIARGRPDQIVNGDQLAAIYGISMGVIPHPTRGVPICYVE